MNALWSVYFRSCRLSEVRSILGPVILQFWPGGLSYLAILLIAGTLILAVLDAVHCSSCAGSWTISILCCQGKTCQKA